MDLIDWDNLDWNFEIRNIIIIMTILGLMILRFLNKLFSKKITKDVIGAKYTYPLGVRIMLYVCFFLIALLWIYGLSEGYYQEMPETVIFLGLLLMFGLFACIETYKYWVLEEDKITSWRFGRNLKSCAYQDVKLISQNSLAVQFRNQDNKVIMRIPCELKGGQEVVDFISEKSGAEPIEVKDHSQGY